MGPHPNKQGVLVYDLRQDPKPFLAMDAQQLADAWKYNPDREAIKLPVKSMQLNRAPAIAPLNVIDSATAKSLQLDG